MLRWSAAGGLLKRALARPSPLRGAPSAGLHVTIQAVPREHTGCKMAAKERADGRIPSMVFTPGEGGTVPTRRQFLTTERKQIRLILRKFPFLFSTKFQIQVRAGAGSNVVLNAGTVLPVRVHKNAETGEILNLVMAWADPGSQLVVDVPVVFKGEDVCPGLKKGGYLHKIRESLKYLCPTEHIPQKIEVDLTKLDIGDGILINDIEVHPSLKLLIKSEDKRPICKIRATKPAHPEPKIAPETVTETPDPWKLNLLH